MPNDFQPRAGAVAVGIHGIFPGYPVSVGSIQHDVDVRYPYLLPRDHFTGKFQVYSSDQPFVPFFEKYPYVYSGRAVTGTGDLRPVFFDSRRYAGSRGTGVSQEPGPVRAVSVKEAYYE